MAEILIFESLDGLQERAAGDVARLALEKARQGRDFSIALAGGSTPRGVYERLAEGKLEEGLPWERVHFFWGDERHVGPDHPQSNYRMAWEAMLSKSPVPPQNIHRIHAEINEPGRAADLYEGELSRYFRTGPGGWPRFDLVLLGMGADGHTASLFPGTAALHETGRPVVANRVDSLGRWRITLTAEAINHAARVVLLVSGRAKAAALAEALDGPYQPDRLPVQLIEPISGDLIWMVDRAAASELKSPS